MTHFGSIEARLAVRTPSPRRLVTGATLLAALWLTGGCVSLDTVSLTQIPASRQHKVRSESDRWIIFFLNFDNDYVDKARNELRDKCQGGKVTGILTKDETVNYFLMLVHKRRIVAEGYCLKG